MARHWGTVPYIRCPETIRRSRDQVRNAVEGLDLRVWFGSVSQADKRMSDRNQSWAVEGN